MRFPVEAKQMRPQQRTALRVKMGKKAAPAQQIKVKKEDVECFQCQNHDQKTEEELSEAKPVSDAVPSAVHDGAGDHQD